MSLDFMSSESAFDSIGEEKEPFWVFTTSHRWASGGIIICTCVITALSILAYKWNWAFHKQSEHTQTMNAHYLDLRQRYLESIESRIAEQVFDPRTQESLIEKGRLFENEHYPNGPHSQVLIQAPIVPTKDLHDVNLKLVGTSTGKNYRHVSLRVEDPSTRRFVDNLTRADFEVYLGQERLSTVVVQETEVTSEPRAIAILQDKSGSTKGEADRDANAAVSSFIGAYANPSKIRLWIFSDSATALCPWTIDKDLLRSAAAGKEPNGGTAIYDSALLVIEDLTKRPEVRVLIVVTDGTDSTKRDLLPTVIQRAKAANVAIYTVGLKSSALNETPLKLLASETGGKYYLAEQSQDLSSRLREVASSIFSPAYRLIALVPNNTDDPLRVEVGNSKLTVQPTNNW